MMKKILISIAFVLFSITAFSQESNIESLKALLIQASKEITAINCDFVQTKESSMLAEKALSYGKMSYRKPDYLKWSYEQPFQYSFVLDGCNSTIEKNKMIREIARIIKGTVEGEYFNNSNYFDTDIHTDDGLIFVILLPKNKELKKLWAKMVLKYNASDFSVKSFEMYENTGDITTITFKNCRYEFSK